MGMFMLESPLRIAVVPGDGIGPEVCSCAVDVLQTVLADVCPLDIQYYEGGADCYRVHGDALPEATLDGCRKADAVLHGAAGLPDVVYPDGTEAGQDFSMKMRAALDLYANIRPVKSYPSVPGVLIATADRPIDYVIVRENTEGLYAARSGGNIVRDRVATDTLVISRDGVERITHMAARLALSRQGAPADGKRRVTIVDKANVLRSYAFFRKVALEVLAGYPEIETECILIDAMTTYMVQQPDRFDVVVTENIFGDILSDLGAGTVGGLGLAASSEVGDRYGYFQGIHGSAPGIQGCGIANPIATILSAGQMLDWLSDKPGWEALAPAGRRIRLATEAAIADRSGLTVDVGGTANTAACVAAVKANLPPSSEGDRADNPVFMDAGRS